MKIKDDISAAGYFAGWSLVKHLPVPLAKWLFNKVADKVSHDGAGMEQLRRNLMRIVGPENVTRELVRDSMRSYMRYWMEAFRLQSLSQDADLHRQLLAGLEGKELLDASLNSPKGTILALTHSGNWDMAGVFLVGYNGPFTTVAERVKPESLFRAFLDYRQALGFKVIALTGGEQPPYEELKQALEAGEVVCLLSERDLTRHGVEVDFFGEPCNMATGPARLAQETGAHLHAVHCFFHDGNDDESGASVAGGSPRWGMTVSEPIEVDDIKTTTQSLARHFEKFLRRRPQDWHMLQPQWNVDIEQRRLRRAERESREENQAARQKKKGRK